MTRRSRRSFILFSTVAVAALVVSCSDSTGPTPSIEGRFGIAPRFESSAAGIIPLGSIRFLLQRPTDTLPARDTTITIAAGQDSVVLEITVAMLSSTETFQLSVEIRDTAGAVVFRGGPVPVSPTSGDAPPPVVPIDIEYVGVGSNAASVRILPPDSVALLTGDSVLIVAQALDSAGEPIANTPIAFTSLDTTIARFPSAARGWVLGRDQRGTTRFVATLLTGPADTGFATVQPLPTGIAVQAGSGQTATVDSALAQQLVARATAADGIGVSGLWVRFTATGGGGTVTPDSARTDASGDARAFWRLGGAAGQQTVSATIARLAGQAAQFTATATAGAPAALAIEAGDGQTAEADAAVAVAPAVLATDAGGNPVPGTAVTFEVLTGGGSLTGAAATTDAQGIATVGSWTLGTTLGGNTLRAWRLGPGGVGDTLSVTFSATAVAGPPTALTIVAGDAQSDTAGATLVDSAAVQVTDAGGHPAAGATIAWAVTAGGGSISDDTTTADASGLAWVHWTVGTAAGNAQELVAEILGGADSATFTATVTHASPDQLAFTSSPTDTFPGAVLTPAVTVEIRDQFGNLINGDNSTDVTLTIEAGTGTAGAVLGGTVVRTASNGIATFDDVTVDRAGTGYQLHAATVGGLTPGTSGAFAIATPPGGTHWAAPVSGSWDDPGMWSAGVVPTPADTAFITVEGNYVVTVGSGIAATAAVLETGSSATVSIEGGTLTIDSAGLFGPSATLAVSSGTLAGPATITIDGTLLWSGGGMTGTGETFISATGVATLTGTATKSQNTRTFRNAGSLTWDGGWWQLTGANPTAVHNEPGATLDAVGGRRLTWGTTPAGKGFVNQGTFLAEADTVEIPWTQEGQVIVAAGGPLIVSGGGTLGGTVDVDPANLLRIQSGAVTFASSFAFTNAGRFELTNTTVTVNAGDSIVLPRFAHSGGTLTGDGAFTVTDSLLWTNGMQAGTGTTYLPSGATAVLSSANLKTLNQRTFRNAGTVRLEDGLWRLDGATPTTILNTVDGTLELVGARTIEWGNTPAGKAFQNDGVLLAPAGGTMDVPFTQNGQLTVGPALFSLTEGATLGDTVDVDPAGALRIQTVPVSFANDFTFPNTGRVELLSSTLTIGAGDSIVLPRFAHSGGTLTGDGAFTVTDSLLWTNGTQAGTGTTYLPSGATAVLSSANLKTLNQRTFQNAGIVRLEDGLWRLDGATPTTILNTVDGTLELVGARTIEWGNTPAGKAFQNDGVLLAPAGGTMDVPFTQNGQLTVGPALFSLTEGATLGDTVDVDPAGALRIQTVPVSFANDFTFPNTGRVELLSSTLTIGAGDSIVLPRFAHSGGTLTGDGAFTVTDSLLWTNGTQAGTGTTYLPSGATAVLSGANIKTLSQRTFQNAGIVRLEDGLWRLDGATPTTILNTVDGTLELVGARTIEWGNTPAGKAFQNDGVLLAPAGGTMDVPFTQNGQLTVGAALFSLTEGATLGDTVDVDPAGALRIQAVSVSFANDFTFPNTGRVELLSATLTVNAGDSIVLPRFAHSGGTLTGDGAFTVTDSLLWTNGTQAGTGTTYLPSGATAVLSGANIKTLSQRTFQNAGIVRLEDGLWRLDGATPTTILNTVDGTLELVGARTIEWGNTPAGKLLQNDGLLLARPGIGNTATLDIPVTLNGTLRADTGTTALTEPALTVASTATIAGTGTLDLSAVDPITIPGVVVPGTSPGRITIVGDVTLDATATLTVEIDGAIPETGHDQLVLTGGTLTLDGTLDVSFGFTPFGTQFPVVVAPTIAGAFQTVNLPAIAGLNLGVLLAADGSTDTLFVTSDIAGAPPGTNAMWTGTASTDWTDPGNWFAGYVPAIGDNVYVTAGTFSPTIPTPTVLGFLIADPSVTITANDSLTLTGDLAVGYGPGIAGPGVLTLDGTPLFVHGRVGDLVVLQDAALTDSLIVEGDLTVDGGGLNPLASRVVVNGDLTTLAGGVLIMVQATDTILVAGNALFAGGDTDGLLTDGNLILYGDLIQTTDPLAFVATGSHTTDFRATATISFTHPGATTSRFARLLVHPESSGSVTLASDAWADFVSVTDENGQAPSVTGTGALTVNDDFDLLDDNLFNGASVTVRRVSVMGDLNVGGSQFAFQPDTAIFLGAAGQTIPVQGFSSPYNVVVVKGDSVALESSFNSAIGTIIVDENGVLDLGNGTFDINDSLITRGNGAIRKTAASTVTLFGTALFAGGSTAGRLTAGQLDVYGDFRQDGTNDPQSFAPSGVFTVRITGDTDDTSYVSFTTPDTTSGSAFERLDLFRGPSSGGPSKTVRIEGTVPVRRWTRLDDNGGDGPIRLDALSDSLVTGDSLVFSATGAGVDILGGHLTVRVFMTTPTGGVTLDADTLEFAGPMQVPEYGQYPTTLITADITSPFQPAYGFDNLVIGEGGDFQCDTCTVTTGYLVTRGTGVLGQIGGTITADSAEFAGGSTAGRLGTGSLILTGSFRQLSTNSPLSFAASMGHLTTFNGDAVKSVSFASPDSTLSRFGAFRVAGNNLTLQTAVHALATFTNQTAPALIRTIQGTGAPLTVRGLIADSVSFNNLPLRVVDGFPLVTFNDSRFVGMDPAASQLEIRRSAGANTFVFVQFGTPPTTGRYLYLEDPDGATGGTYALTLNSTTPAQHSGFADTLNANLVGWPIGSEAPTVLWTGGGDGTNWTDAANWSSTPSLPTATDSVVIGLDGAAVTVNTSPNVRWLTMNGASGTQTLTIPNGQTLTVDSVALWNANSVLNLSGGTLAIAATGVMSSLGTVNWSGGTILSASGASGAFFNGPVNVTLGTGKALDGATVVIGGAMTISGTGPLSGQNGGALSIGPTGTLDIQTDMDLLKGVGAVPLFSNQGTLTKTGGPLTARIDWEIANLGRIDVASGTLDLRDYFAHALDTAFVRGGATLALRGESDVFGTIFTDAGGVLEMTAGGCANTTSCSGDNAAIHTFGFGSDISGAGTVSVNGANLVDIQGGYDVDSTYMTGATLEFNGTDTAFTTNGQYAGGGFLQGSGILAIRGGFVAGVGNFNGPATVSVLPGGTLTLPVGGGFRNGTIDVGGSLIWPAGGGVTLALGASIHVLPGGTFTQQGAGNLAGSAAESVVNDGTIVHTGGGTWSPNLTNNGILDIQSGTLVVQGFSHNDGASLRGTGALTLGTGSATFGGDIEPAGPNVLGTLSITGDVTLAGTSTLRIDANDGPGSDLLNVTGTFTRGGTVEFVPVGVGPGLPFTIVTASGGISGSPDFATVLPVIGWLPTISGNSLVVTSP